MTLVEEGRARPEKLRCLENRWRLNRPVGLVELSRGAAA